MRTRKSFLRKCRRRRGRSRRLWVESLEQRRLLTTAIRVDTFQDVIDPMDGFTSLREAVIQANEGQDDFTIELGRGTYMLTIAGGQEDESLRGDIDIRLAAGSRFTIQGLGSDQTTVTGNGIDRVFHVHGGAVTFTQLSIRDGVATRGEADVYGGGVLIAAGSDVTFDSTQIANNTAEAARSVVGQPGFGAFGGGVAIQAGTELTPTIVTFVDSQVRGNHAVGPTGRDYSSGGKLVIAVSGTNTSGKDGGNGGDAYGGGIYFAGGGALTIRGTHVSENSAQGGDGGAGEHGPKREHLISDGGDGGNGGVAEGGGLYVAGGKVDLVETLFASNTAVGGGGGTSGDGGPNLQCGLNENPGLFSGSHPGHPGEAGLALGGGAFFEGGVVKAVDIAFSENLASGGHGGDSGNGEINVCNSGRSASGRPGAAGAVGGGGGLYVAVASDVEVDGLLVSSNIAQGGSGGDAGKGSFHAAGGSGSGGHGGGVYFEGFRDGDQPQEAQLVLARAQFFDNQAKGGNGGKGSDSQPGPAGKGGNGGYGKGGHLFLSGGTTLLSVQGDHRNVLLWDDGIIGGGATGGRGGLSGEGGGQGGVGGGAQGAGVCLHDGGNLSVWAESMPPGSTGQLNIAHLRAIGGDGGVGGSTGGDGGDVEGGFLYADADTSVTYGDTAFTDVLAVAGNGGLGGEDSGNVGVVRGNIHYPENYPGEFSTITGSVWQDGPPAAADGIREVGESGLSNVLVEVFDTSHVFLGADYTNNEGEYRIESNFVGDVYFEFTLLDGLLFSPQDAGSDDTVDSDVDPTSGGTDMFVLAAGSIHDNIDAGMRLSPGPMAVPGGPYLGKEGSPIALDGSSSFVPLPPGTIVSYEWDLDYDGVQFDVHRTGIKPSVTFADDFETRMIALRVTDSESLVDVATTTLTVTNVAPTAAPGPSYRSGLNFSVSIEEERGYWLPDYLDLPIYDPGDDTVTHWIVDWRDGQIETFRSDESKSHIYDFETLDPLSKTVELKISFVDEDGTHELLDRPRLTVQDVNEAPQVVTHIPDQQAEENQPFVFTLASNTFHDVDAGDSLTFSATQADNSALPAWLHFDSASRTFSGTPQIGDNGGIDLKVTARDAGHPALSTDDVFRISISADPHPWQNPRPSAMNAMDVNDDGTVAPDDVLIIMNSLNLDGSRPLHTPSTQAEIKYYVDVNGDNFCAPIDALIVINYLNDPLHGAAEGEAILVRRTVQRPLWPFANSASLGRPQFKRSESRDVNSLQQLATDNVRSMPGQSHRCCRDSDQEQPPLDYRQRQLGLLDELDFAFPDLEDVLLDLSASF